MNKCIGCGSVLQSEDSNQVGYTRDLEKPLCERCFRIRNYSDYKLVSNNNEEFIDILNNIGHKDALVLLVVDLFNMPNMLSSLNQYLSNDVLLVLTKRDLLPRDVYDVKLKKYFADLPLHIVDSIIVSSIKNNHIDELLNMIRQYQKGREVYVVGFTNAGKSTLINHLLTSYTGEKPVITTSMLPSTTIGVIKIAIDDTLTLIDTPGLLDEHSLINYVSIDTLKKIIPKREIKPRSYQIKGRQSLIIDELLRLDSTDNNLIFFIANDLEIKRKYNNSDELKNLCHHIVKAHAYEDIVISGLGFIKVMKDEDVDIYTKEEVEVYTRKSLI